MGRPRQYPSVADRQRAYRERKRAELQGSVPEPELDEVVAAIVEIAAEDDGFAEVKLGPDLPSEDEYVEQALAAGNLLDRRRAEAYARWRYKGVLEGRVASL